MSKDVEKAVKTAGWHYYRYGLDHSASRELYGAFVEVRFHKHGFGGCVVYLGGSRRRDPNEEGVAWFSATGTRLGWPKISQARFDIGKFLEVVRVDLADAADRARRLVTKARDAQERFAEWCAKSVRDPNALRAGFIE